LAEEFSILNFQFSMNDLISKFSKTKLFLLELLFPKFCLGCQKEGFYLCEDCRATLEISENNYCLCSQNHKALAPNSKLGKCNRCSDKKLSGLYFALPFKDPSAGSGQETYLTKKLVHQFKYGPYTKNLAKTLASLIIEHLVITQKNTDEIWNNGVLVPVPLDKKKLKIRNYNQSEELAKELSKVLQIPVVSDILIKTKTTKPQMELSKEQREKNLLGAFAISSPSLRGAEATKQSLKNKKVFLVDDVYTTGSTMEECARVLRTAGAKSVWGITVAREE